MNALVANQNYRAGYDERAGNRWRSWYSAIADYELYHPGCSVQQIADGLGKAYGTVIYVRQTDAYKEYLAQRRKEFEAQANARLADKISGVAGKALDLMQEKMEKESTKIPLNTLASIADSTLDRLGYGPKAPVVQVNQTTNVDNRSLHVGLRPEEIERARAALRAAEAHRGAQPQAALPAPSGEIVDGTFVEINDKEEALLAALIEPAERES